MKNRAAELLQSLGGDVRRMQAAVGANGEINLALLSRQGGIAHTRCQG